MERSGAERRKTIEDLAWRLDAEGVDWEPNHRAQSYRPRRRRGRFGL
jgi:hypothetical protein